MFSSRLATIFFVLCLIALLEIMEARPRIRHHKSESRCSRCGPGFGVTIACTLEHDTECGKCERGTYSRHHNLQPCWICSRCGPGLYEAHPCTSKTDTVCDSCHRHAPENSDYRRKCKGRANLFLAPEDAKSTGEESLLVNEDTDEMFEEKEREIILAKDIEADLIDQRTSMQRF